MLNADYRSKYEKEFGITLVELVVSVAIISMMAGLAHAGYRVFLIRAENMKARAFAEQMYKLLPSVHAEIVETYNNEPSILNTRGSSSCIAGGKRFDSNHCVSYQYDGGAAVTNFIPMNVRRDKSLFIEVVADYDPGVRSYISVTATPCKGDEIYWFRFEYLENREYKTIYKIDDDGQPIQWRSRYCL